MAEQEVIVKFKADTSEIETSIKTMTAELRKADGMEIEPISEESAANVDKAAKGIKDLGKEVSATTTKAKPLKTILKEMKTELIALEAAGKGNSKRFKELSKEAGELEDQIGDVGQQVRNLASDTPRLDALISAATGIAGAFSLAQGAAALFGSENEDVQKALLKVQAAMAILNGLQAIAATLNKTSAISTFLNANANTVLGKAVNGTIGAFKKLFAVLVANPMIAAAVAIAGIVTAITLFTDKNAEAVEQQKRLNDAIAAAEQAADDYKAKIEEVIAKVKERYDEEIKLAAAAGKDTADLQSQSLEEQRRVLEKSLNEGRELRKRYNKQIEVDEAAATLLFVEAFQERDNFRRLQLQKEAKERAESAKFAKANRVELEQLIQDGEKKVTSIQNEEKAVRLVADRKASEDAKKAAEDRLRKAKEFEDKQKELEAKRIADALAALDMEQKQREKILLQSNLNEEDFNAARTNLQVEFIQKRIDLLKKLGQATIDEELKLLDQLRSIELQKQEQKKEEIKKTIELQEKFDDEVIAAMEEGAEKQKAQRLRDFDKKIQELEEQGILTAELEKSLQKQLIADLQKIDEEEAEARRQIMLKEIEARKLMIDASIKIFEDGISIISDIIEIAGIDAAHAAEFQKTLAVFQVGLELAKSLATVISSATTAAAATGPLAPITLAGYIASGLASIFGAFAQVKQIFNAPVPKPAAKGEELVTGGRPGKDSVLYNLMPGERVMRQDTNMKYWDELHAMHMGRDYFDKLVSIKYVQPAIQEVLSGHTGGVSSVGVTGKAWKGGNIVDALGRTAKQSKKQHRQMMEALKPRRVNLRKF